MTGFREAPKLDHWVNSGVYVLGEEALALLPEKGDHELSTFPELAAARRLRAYRHEGVWLTVNTPKDLRRASEFMEAHPDWKPQRGSSRERRLAELRLARSVRLRAAPRREAVGLGADLGGGRRLRRQGAVRARERVALAPVPPAEGRELVRAERPRAARARRGGTGGARRGGRRRRRVLPLPSRHRAPADGARGHDDPRGLDAAARRRRAARGPRHGREGTSNP